MCCKQQAGRDGPNDRNEGYFFPPAGAHISVFSGFSWRLKLFSVKQGKIK
jgi:hypothetical protein